MSNNLVDRWFRAFLNKDVSQLERNLADDFTHSSPYGVVDSKRAYIDLVKNNEAAFFDHTIEIQDTIESGDRAAVRYLVDGRPACDCIYVEKGLIAGIVSYYHVGEKPTMQP